MAPTKLKRDNYLVWKALFAPIFRSYKLTGIVDGFEICSPPYLLDQTDRNTGIPNPAFEAWYEKDHNILIWLNSTLSKEIILFTVGVTSSCELWLNLENRFGVVFVVHIHQLRSRLHSIHKGDLSTYEYLQRIKGISNALMVVGSPVSDHDLIAVTLNGLSNEYESFIDSIMLRISSTTLDELHGLLINKELFMNCKKKAMSLPLKNSSRPLLLNLRVLSFLHHNTIPFPKLMLMLSFMLLPNFRTIVAKDNFSATIMVITPRTSTILLTSRFMVQERLLTSHSFFRR